MENIQLKKFVISLYVILISVLVLGMFRGNSSVSRYFELKSNLKVLRTHVVELEKSNQDIEMEIHKIKTSPLYAQKMLKDRYHAVEENEDIIFFAD